MGLFTGLGKALSEFKKDFKRVRNWEKRNQKWIKENDRKLKEFKRIEEKLFEALSSIIPVMIIMLIIGFILRIGN